MASLDWLQECMQTHLSHEQQMQFEGLFQQAKEIDKQQRIDELIGLQIYLNDKDLITNYDWDFEKIAKRYYKTSNKKQMSIQPFIKTNIEPTNEPSINWILVNKKLPEFGKEVLILTDYGKMDVCYLTLEDNRILDWRNAMRSQHSNGGVIAWTELPTHNITL